MDETKNVYRIYRKNEAKEPFLIYGNIVFKFLYGRYGDKKYCGGFYILSAEDSFTVGSTAVINNC
jgi:hypothetical protein